MIKKSLHIFGLAILASFLIIGTAVASEATGTVSTGADSGSTGTGIEGILTTAPSVSPAAGTYTSTQTVTVTATGSAGICYTTDGTTPVCASAGSTCTTGTLYSSTISVASTKTIKSISCYANNVQSSVTSSTYTINSGGGGGGGGATGSTNTPMPVTTNGLVTATQTGGGKTTLTDGDGTKATITVPASTVSYSSEFQISPIEQVSDTASGMVIGLGSGQSIVGNLYNYTAQSGSSVLKVFSKSLTITMTYTSDQIAGLNESDLKIYYWDENTSEWIALSSTVDKVNNIITATTDHFTYFAIITGAGTGEEGGEVIGETTDIVDGDVVRAPDAPGMDQFDVYIIKLINGKKFRRLVLSPHVFESYGHLEWGNIKDITNNQMQTYEISNIIRCYDPTEGVNDPKVYRLYPDGDVGAKRWMNMEANRFGASYDWDSIYFINKVDRDAYSTGEDLTS